MEFSSQFALRGLFLAVIISGFGMLRVDAQVLKGINDAVKTATEPAKDASKIVKEAAQPAKDANKAIKTVTKAPEKVEKEYEKVGKEVERTEKEYEKMTDQVKKSSDDDKKEAKTSDSTATKTADADSKAADNPTHKTATPPDYQPKPQPQPTPVTVKKADPPADLPRPVPPGSRDNKTPSGPLPTTDATPTSSAPQDSATTTPLTDSEITARENAAKNNGSIDSGFHVASDGKTTEEPATSDNAAMQDSAAAAKADVVVVEAPNADSLQGVAPKESEVADNSAAKSSESASASGNEAGTAFGDENSQDVAPVVKPPITYPVPGGGERRPKQDYSKSPARIQLEQAEYDVETLEDLFRYSAWDGPERDHTVRSVAFALDELQAMIVEIKKIDPGQSTWRFEETYKDMKAAYLEEMKRMREQQGE